MIIEDISDRDISIVLNHLAQSCYERSKEKGWHDQEVDASFVERLCLIHSEISEALEEYRNGHSLTETRIENNKPEGIPIEISDILIRVFDMCGKHGINIGAAVLQKLEYNKTRPYRHGNKKV